MYYLHYVVLSYKIQNKYETKNIKANMNTVI